MFEFSRRSFIAGALTLLSVRAVHLTPSEAAGGGNYQPCIYGDGKNYDAEGFQALFDKQPVIIPADKIKIIDCKRVIIERGNFVIDKEVWASYGALDIQGGQIDGRLLHWYEAFFSIPDGERAALNRNVKWLRSEGHGTIYDGHRMFGTNYMHIADINRMRPPAPREI